MGAAAVGATIYFGSDESTPADRRGRRGLRGGARAGHVHRALVLPAQPGLQAKDGKDYHVSADLTGQANHLGVTIQADIIKQKLPENNGGYNALNSRASARPTSVVQRADDRPPDRPHPLPGGQLLHGPRRPDQQRRRASGESDLAEAVRTAVINKRAGGMGLISGRKAFQRPMDEGIELLNAIQDARCGARPGDRPSRPFPTSPPSRRCCRARQARSALRNEAGAIKPGIGNSPTKRSTAARSPSRASAPEASASATEISPWISASSVPGSRVRTHRVTAARRGRGRSRRPSTTPRGSRARRAAGRTAP